MSCFFSRNQQFLQGSGRNRCTPKAVLCEYGERSVLLLWDDE